jgi:methyltransferase-like protein 6
VLFRDYGRYDAAQIRFAKENRANKLEPNLYVRQDGTLAYYFTTEEIAALFAAEGLYPVKNEYIRRIYRNRKLNQSMHRVWVQSKFRKP